MQAKLIIIILLQDNNHLVYCFVFCGQVNFFIRSFPRNNSKAWFAPVKQTNGNLIKQRNIMAKVLKRNVGHN